MNTMRKYSIFMMLFSLALVAAACGGGSPDGDMKSIQSKKTDDNLTVTLSGSAGKLKNGKQDLLLSFSDADGKPAEISAATLNFNMPAMGSMAEMNDSATLATTPTVGQFKCSANLSMAGEWQVQITYEGKSGKGKVSFPVTAN